MSGTERHPSHPSSISSVERGDHGIDDDGERDVRRVRVAGIALHLDDGDLEQRVHLWCGEAGAVVLAHGLDHVVDEALDLRGADALQAAPGCADLAQDRMPQPGDLENRHNSKSVARSLQRERARAQRAARCTTSSPSRAACRSGSSASRLPARTRAALRRSPPAWSAGWRCRGSARGSPPRRGRAGPPAARTLRRSQLGIGRGRDLAVPGADFLADVAAEDPAVERRPELLGDVSAVLDGEVRDAAARVEDVGRDEGAASGRRPGRPCRCRSGRPAARRAPGPPSSGRCR